MSLQKGAGSLINSHQFSAFLCKEKNDSNSAKNNPEEHTYTVYKDLSVTCCKSQNEKMHVANLQVVFRGGEGALQVLPPLVDVIPEARLNLVSNFQVKLSLDVSHKQQSFLGVQSPR